MKSVLSILLLLITTVAFSQTEMHYDSITVKKNLPANIFDPQPLEIQGSLFMNNLPDRKKIEEILPTAFKTSDLRLKVPPVYQGPMSNPDRIPTTFVFENEYNFNNYFGLSHNSGIYTSSSLSVYPGLGAVNTISGSYNYSPADWVSISGGTYVSKYHIYGTSYNDMGVNAHMRLKLHDRVFINTYGQYSAFGDNNKVGGNFPGMFPQTYYGGTLEFKISDKFGIESGMIRELDPMTGKWKNIPYVAPVFYGK